jgi:SAM-dependent methyltransferase
MNRQLQKRFCDLFQIWLPKATETVCGPGSTFEATASIRAMLPIHLQQIGVRRLLDAPCGDAHWIRLLGYQFEDYLGIDIVPDVVARAQPHAHARRRFIVGDFVNDPLPLYGPRDAILCRDGLVHLSNANACTAVENFRMTGAGWLIATTFPGARNEDIADGGWRATDLEAFPFALGLASHLIDERYKNTAKMLGIWSLRQ